MLFGSTEEHRTGSDMGKQKEHGITERRDQAIIQEQSVTCRGHHKAGKDAKIVGVRNRFV